MIFEIGSSSDFLTLIFTSGGNGEEMEREVRSDGETVELGGGGVNGGGVGAEGLVEKMSDESNLRHGNSWCCAQLTDTFRNLKTLVSV